LKSEQIFSLIIDNLQKTCKRLVNYRDQNTWKFFQGEAPEAYKPDFDDSPWKIVKLPLSFDARKGGAWLRCKVIIPEEIEGVKISGSTMKLSSFIIIDKSERFL